jgi:hypothetical protein
MKQRLVVTIFVASLLATSQSAQAQLIDVTPEVFGKVRAAASQAKEKHPTSPREAGYEFQAWFNGEFGDTRPMVATIVNLPDIAVEVITPINFLYSEFARSLQQLEPLTEKPPISLVYIRVTPKRRDAPDVTRIVLFVDGKEVAPVANGLKPTEFKNGLGQPFTIGAGIVAWKPETFTSGVIKVLCINTSGTPIEWNYTPGSLGQLK